MGVLMPVVQGNVQELSCSRSDTILGVSNMTARNAFDPVKHILHLKMPSIIRDKSTTGCLQGDLRPALAQEMFSHARSNYIRVKLLAYVGIYAH